MKRHAGQLAALAATAVFALLFVRHVSWSETRAQLGGIPLTTVLAATLAILLGMAFTALRWSYLLRAAGIESRLPRLFAGLAAGAAVNNVVPARGGDLVRLRSVPAPAFAVAGTLAAERLLDGFVLALFITGGSLAVGSPLLGVGLALTAGTSAGIAVAALRPRWVERLPRRARSFVVGLDVFRSPRLLARALGASAALWLADVLMYAVLAPAFGLRLSVGGAFLLEGIGNLALAVPATAAGVGSFDYLTLVGAHSIGIGGDAAGAYVLAVHAFVVLPATALGLALLFWARPRRAHVGVAVPAGS